MNGSASAPSSATMKGTRCAMSPAIKATSRESRSSLATMTGHFAGLARGKRRSELRSAVQGIGSLAGFRLDELGREFVALRLRKASDRGTLGLDTEA